MGFGSESRRFRLARSAWFFSHNSEFWVSDLAVPGFGFPFFVSL